MVTTRGLTNATTIDRTNLTTARMPKYQTMILLLEVTARILRSHHVSWLSKVLWNTKHLSMMKMSDENKKNVIKSTWT